MVPIDNLADVEMLNDELKESIKFHYVSSFEEVYPIIFPSEQSEAIG